MLYTVVLFSMCLGLALGFLPMRARHPHVTLWTGAGLALLCAASLAFGAAVPGLDGLVFMGLGAFVLAPALLALLIGAGLARWPGRRGTIAARAA